MKTSVNNKKQLVGLLFGLSAGLAFAVFAWGVDGLVLASAHGAYPWVKFIPGLFISLIGGGLVGWLTIRLQNPVLRLLLWFAFALLLSKLFLWLPIKAAPEIIGWFDDYLGNFLNYPLYSDFNHIQWIGFTVIALISILCGLLENLLVEQAIFSASSFSVAVPLIISFVFFCLAGNTIDGLYNRQIRQPIVAVDELIQFAVDNSDKEVSSEMSRAMHLAAVKTIKEFLPLERTLILSNYDQMLGQIDVLVKFNGNWVKCTTVYNQVTFCKLVFDEPKRYYALNSVLFENENV
ncbi:MAG: hypothetical protein ACD_34C00231G0001 [uncultured bacterium]|nr:MAG: hypothetical protein ACD_34C00231G0001 [uncultured bacterium]